MARINHSALTSPRALLGLILFFTLCNSCAISRLKDQVATIQHESETLEIGGHSVMAIDYDALAKQAGSIGSIAAPVSSGVDYDALAKQAGAIGSTASAPLDPVSAVIAANRAQALRNFAALIHSGDPVHAVQVK